MKRPTENHKQVFNAGLVTASASITIGKCAIEMAQLDPNLWYRRWTLYVDQLLGIAEVLQALWEQNREQLEEMSVELPSGLYGLKTPTAAPLADVFREFDKMNPENTNEEGGAISIDDLPF